MTQIPGPIAPPARLLMGPGPISAYPRVLRAMSAAARRAVRPVHDRDDDRDAGSCTAGSGRPRTTRPCSIDGTSRAGIEAAMVSLIRPGDRVLVPVFGRFGHLLAEIAERAMAEVHTIEVPWGQVFPVVGHRGGDRAGQAARCSALVQGDTSTTMRQPLDEIGAICAKHGVLFYSDATASLGGNAVRGGRVGAGCRDRRPAEVPGRSVGLGAHHALGARGRGHPLAQQGRGRHPRRRRRRLRRTSSARTTSTSA